ncbi:AAA family ATPase [Aminobacter sp. HY435]|uniref:AAA family ATPase n=1 Tax=Aminobacter sp. HY435 TaxID=2970917 RepID=UPI0022B9C299|nr:AAA family ATPase [Aminobacter sp. HY435]
MADSGYSRRVSHPYSHNELYAHFRPTTFQHSPWSAAAVPFAWMMKEGETPPEPAARYGIEFRPDWEPALGFNTIWVQERRNQLAMLDTFFGAITPDESLVFFYAKRTPLTDDPRRVIVGIGRVKSVAKPVEYAYEPGTPESALRCMLWERTLHHSIRPEIGDGFLLPYHRLIELADAGSDFDPSPYVLHAPEEHWSAFSMGAEHVSHDQAISALLSATAVLTRYAEVVPGDWEAARRWVDEQLNRLWRFRGAFPGLGSALSALGVESGTLIAHAVEALLHVDGSADVRDPWPLIDDVFKNPARLPPELARGVGPTVARLWVGLPDERRALLKLLARFELTADQARRWFVLEERRAAGIDVPDKAILQNPYVLFEGDRGRLDSISLKVIDRGIFPDAQIAAAVPMPAPSNCPEAIDPRRGRAFLVQALERASGEGHTLLPQDWLIQRVRAEDVSPPCAIGGDWIDAFKTDFPPELEAVTMADGSPAWQLFRHQTTKAVISTRVLRRLSGARHLAQHDWRARIDEKLPSFESVPDAEVEELARQEKALALEELFSSRVSVLIGPAGTGKTSLLEALISFDEIKRDGILLLAPTGKARVQMQRRAATAQAYTLAQFLLASGRYDGSTGAYLVTNEADRENGFGTVIIDEASMLTEDQLAATIDALDPGSVKRLILVGDPRQLPPIGAGRPFVDIIRLLRERGGDGNVQGYAELKIVRRQAQGAGSDLIRRDDLLLSRWFGGDSPDPGADEIWQRLSDGTAQGIRVVRWENDRDLSTALLREIQSHVLALPDAQGLSLEQAFEVSLGGRPYGGHIYFNPTRDPVTGSDGAGKHAEDWQILSPVRGGETGIDGLNRRIQRIFRTSVRSLAEPEQPRYRKVPKPMGSQGILYGDKVINLANGRRKDVYPELNRAYLANGEIGVVVGQFKGKKATYKGLPWKLEVEFSTQPGFKFGFSGRDFGQDGDERLELAYALTIHKSQGSEFGVTFVVVPNPCRPLSRELLYTALTRQRHSVVLFHQGDLRDLIKYSQTEKSDTARRLTNLFSQPDLIEHAAVFMEKGLIHRTARGELVRSKSEVIVADLLHGLGLPYSYEQPFVGGDGSVRYPDFTVDDAETGRLVLVEHLGMLDAPAYLRRWHNKLEWYRKEDVLPFEIGGGKRGVLVTTTEERGIDAAAIKTKLNSVFGI